MDNVAAIDADLLEEVEAQLRQLEDSATTNLLWHGNNTERWIRDEIKNGVFFRELLLNGSPLRSSTEISADIRGWLVTVRRHLKRKQFMSSIQRLPIFLFIFSVFVLERLRIIPTLPREFGFETETVIAFIFGLLAAAVIRNFLIQHLEQNNFARFLDIGLASIIIYFIKINIYVNTRDIALTQGASSSFVAFLLGAGLMQARPLLESFSYFIGKMTKAFRGRQHDITTPTPTSAPIAASTSTAAPPTTPTPTSIIVDPLDRLRLPLDHS